jgi:hypothetical protein
VDLISKVVPVAAGWFSRETQRSATSSRAILPYTGRVGKKNENKRRFKGFGEHNEPSITYVNDTVCNPTP